MVKVLLHILVFTLLIAPESHAARKKGKPRPSKKDLINLKIIVVGRNPAFPVYKAKVSLVSFSGTEKGETDGSGSLEMQFPSGDTVAASITAEGYHPTTTKSYRLTRDKTVKIKIRQNGKSNPLPTPTPTRKPTNPPAAPTAQPTSPPEVPTNPPGAPTRPPGLPTLPPPTIPTLRPEPTPDNGLPNITSHPISQTLARGQRVTLRVAATGTGPFTYQWKVDGVAVAGGVATYSFLAPLTGPSQQHFKISCTVSNAMGSSESKAATILVYTLQNSGNSPAAS